MTQVKALHFYLSTYMECLNYSVTLVNVKGLSIYLYGKQRCNLINRNTFFWLGLSDVGLNGEAECGYCWILMLETRVIFIQGSCFCPYFFHSSNNWKYSDPFKLCSIKLISEISWIWLKSISSIIYFMLSSHLLSWINQVDPKAEGFIKT